MIEQKPTVCNYHTTEKRSYTLEEAKHLVESGMRKSYYLCTGCGMYHTTSMTKSCHKKTTGISTFKAKKNKTFRDQKCGGKKQRTMKAYSSASRRNNDWMAEVDEYYL